MEDTYRDTLLEGHSALLRTSESLARSQQAALEAETIGTSVAEELDCQRETLLRARDRLTDTDYELTRSRQLLRMIRRNIIANNLFLILIIVFEVIILLSLIYVKFLKH